MDTKKKKDYKAPVLTVVSFMVEQGFARSGSIVKIHGEFDQSTSRNDYGQENVESWF